MRKAPELLGRPVGDALSRLVTLGGRIPFVVAIEALTPWEATLVKWLLGREEPVLLPPDDVSPGPHCVVTQSPMGKLSLWRSSEAIAEGETPIGAFVVPPDVDEQVAEIVDEEASVEAFERAQLDEWLLDVERRGAIAAFVDEVIDRVDHVESVHMYIDRTVCARSDVGNTLLRGGALPPLKERPVAEWTPAERLFVTAFHILFASGRSIRLEEFNGRALTAIRLRRWAVRRLLLYSAKLGERVPPGAPAQPLMEIATRIAVLRARLEDAGVLGFRRIIGLTLLKEERLLPLEAFPHEPDVLPPPVEHLANEWGIDLGPQKSAYEAVSLLADAAIRAKAADPNSDATEMLLERIVLAGIIAGGADYGMSSSIRDLRRLRQRDELRCSGVLELQKPDFFCVCLPHPAMPDAVDETQLFEILNAVALRMQFNRWHFIAGNFERHEVPTTRHYFFPPAMPDMAQFSEARHGGHTLAWVRYSVRAPGPQLWRPPLEVFGNKYRGFFDTRLVRFVEPPFMRREMATASRHTALMDAFWRTAARLVETGEVDAEIVTGFDRQYYRDEKWRRATDAIEPVDADTSLRARLRPRRLRT